MTEEHYYGISSLLGCIIVLQSHVSVHRALNLM